MITTRKTLTRLIGWTLLALSMPPTLWPFISGTNEFLVTPMHILHWMGGSEDAMRLTLSNMFSPGSWDSFFVHAVNLPLDLMAVLLGLYMVVRSFRDHEPEGPSVKRVISEQSYLQLTRRGGV